ncbi:MAG: response regulator transcription factor [Candidatus Aminicenantales bacterium]|jgi:two-component system alkaline phosphatase synthesis response regulator PhoP
MKEKILIIEDEEDLVKGLKLNLAGEGYDVAWAYDGQEGIRKALEERPDLIILDIMLPKMDGLEVCREIRQKNMNIPIIMLTAKGEEVDKVVGLEVGADDYITKPFSIRELLARLKAHLRREKREVKKIPEAYSFGDVEVDFSHFKVRRKGKEVDLTSLEVEILKYFVAHRGEVVTREALLDKIWGYERFPTTRTIDNHILKLRKKIEEDPAHPKYIFSVYGAGYRFMG